MWSQVDVFGHVLKNETSYITTQLFGFSRLSEYGDL